MTIVADTSSSQGQPSMATRLWRSLTHECQQSPALALSLTFLALVALLALAAPLLPYDAYKQDVLHRNALPSLAHWLGTDELGRDMVSRLAVGARVSLVVAVVSTLIAVSLGVMVGTISAYAGGRTDRLVMRFVDSMYAFPDTLLASGRAEIRARHVERFQEPDLHGKLVNRIVNGDVVVDQEIVTRNFADGPGEIDVVAIYEVRGQHIARAWFKLGQPRLHARPA